MKLLKFFASIKNSDQKFSAIAAFDDYFCFSGRKYRVIEPFLCDGKKGYRVERCYSKPNIPLNIIKAISYASFIIPIIMGLGKLIARSGYRFYIEIDSNEEKKTESSPQSSSASARKTHPPKASSHRGNKATRVFSPIQQDVKDRAEKTKEFKDKALNVFHQKKLEVPPFIDFSLTKEQQECLAKSNWRSATPSVGVKLIRGGCNYVLFLDCVAGFVFKPMESQHKAEDYIAIANNARRVIIENGLYLLHVPESKVIKIEGTYFVGQENADLVFSGYKEQKGVYSYCWDDEEMEDYMKTLIDQLICFISKTNFGDVKYDNIPFTKVGKVALIDLDQTSDYTGLTGGVEKKEGLFNYIPHQFLDYFLESSKTHLNEQTYNKLAEEITNIKEKAEKKVSKRKDYSKFLQKGSISLPSQNINSDLPKLFKDKKKQQFAKYIIEKINEKLSEVKNFSIKEGRTIHLPTNIDDPLYNKAKEIWGNNLVFLKDPKKASFKSILPEILQDLEKGGYIYKYKISPYYPEVKIIC